MTPNLVSNARAVGLDTYIGSTLWVFQVKMCRVLSQSYGTAHRTDFNHLYGLVHRGTKRGAVYKQ